MVRWGLESENCSENYILQENKISRMNKIKLHDVEIEVWFIGININKNVDCKENIGMSLVNKHVKNLIGVAKMQST